MKPEDLLKRYGAAPLNTYSISDLANTVIDSFVYYVVEDRLKSSLNASIIRFPHLTFLGPIPQESSEYSSDEDFVIIRVKGLMESFDFPLSFISSTPVLNMNYKVSLNNLYFDSQKLDALFTQAVEGF